MQGTWPLALALELPPLDAEPELELKLLPPSLPDGCKGTQMVLSGKVSYSLNHRTKHTTTNKGVEHKTTNRNRRVSDRKNAKLRQQHCPCACFPDYPGGCGAGNSSRRTKGNTSAIVFSQ
jgi:hypothetical protein